MNSDKLYELQAPYLEMTKAKILLHPFMVAKDHVKEVFSESTKSPELSEKDVFIDVDET